MTSQTPFNFDISNSIMDVNIGVFNAVTVSINTGVVPVNVQVPSNFEYGYLYMSGSRTLTHLVPVAFKNLKSQVCGFVWSNGSAVYDATLTMTINDDYTITQFKLQSSYGNTIPFGGFVITFTPKT